MVTAAEPKRALDLLNNNLPNLTKPANQTSYQYVLNIINRLEQSGKLNHVANLLHLKPATLRDLLKTLAKDLENKDGAYGINTLINNLILLETGKHIEQQIASYIEIYKKILEQEAELLDAETGNTDTIMEDDAEELSQQVAEEPTLVQLNRIKEREQEIAKILAELREKIDKTGAEIAELDHIIFKERLNLVNGNIFSLVLANIDSKNTISTGFIGNNPAGNLNADLKNISNIFADLKQANNDLMQSIENEQIVSIMSGNGPAEKLKIMLQYRFLDMQVKIAIRKADEIIAAAKSLEEGQLTPEASKYFKTLTDAKNFFGVLTPTQKAEALKVPVEQINLAEASQKNGVLVEGAQQYFNDMQAVQKFLADAEAKFQPIYKEQRDPQVNTAIQMRNTLIAYQNEVKLQREQFNTLNQRMDVKQKDMENLVSELDKVKKEAEELAKEAQNLQTRLGQRNNIPATSISSTPSATLTASGKRKNRDEDQEDIEQRSSKRPAPAPIRNKN